MQPFDQIDPHAPYPTAFRSHYPLFIIVSIGPLISLSGTLFTTIYATVRIAYTMANDGLLFSSLASINPRTQVPYTSTILSALVSLVLVIAIDVRDLIGFTDITAFLTYTFTALCLLVVRYCNHDDYDTTSGNASSIVESSLDNYASLLNDPSDDHHDNNDDSEEHVENLPPSRPKNTNFLNRIRKWKYFRMRDNILNLIVLVFLTNVTYFGLLEYFVIIRTMLVTLIVITNFIFVVILSIVEQIKPPSTLSFKVNDIFDF